MRDLKKKKKKKVTQSETDRKAEQFTALQTSSIDSADNPTFNPYFLFLLFSDV